MKTNRLLLGLLACAGVCACANEDLNPATDNVPGVFEGDEAYINVRIADAGSLTKATSGDPDYEYGSEDEHAVQNAFFYFYDKDGYFVSEGSAWNGGTPSSENPNIEFKGNNVVVLKGLTKKKYPKYMVTVLNRPAGLQAEGSVPRTLKDMEEKLSVENAEDGGFMAGGKFVMSTTSYKRADASAQGIPAYFVTEVEEKNFSPEPVDHAKNSSNYVTVYVERLAAKVTLKIGSGLTPAMSTGGQDYYEIRATVAGSGNDADIPKDGDAADAVADGDNADGDNADGEETAAEKLYVRLEGWKLNATAKKSRLVKNIDESWADYYPFNDWNKSSDFRSFWGKSYNYGSEGGYTYPGSSTQAEGNTVPLKYFNLNTELLKLNDDSGYCAENTNTSDIVSANYPSAVTSILLKATVCDENGQPLDLVRFNGVLFNRDSFLKYILARQSGLGNLNAWKKTGDNNTYEEIGLGEVELSDNNDGKVLVQLKNGLTEQLYSRTEADGKLTYSNITNESVNNVLKNAYNDGDAIGYKGGLMYYNIPIEHLNNADVVDGNIPEAKYGVVRNHHYVVTINKLEKMGKGIFDPDEVIVPGEDPDKDTYYVGADINILSWKVVSQGVEL